MCSRCISLDDTHPSSAYTRSEVCKDVHCSVVCNNQKSRNKPRGSSTREGVNKLWFIDPATQHRSYCEGAGTPFISGECGLQLAEDSKFETMQEYWELFVDTY